MKSSNTGFFPVEEDASHGAGTAAANLLSSARVSAVVSGRFGPNALDVLRALGIEAWVAPPGINAGVALLMLEGGRLERMESSGTR
jgi:predicted Fe-Mo cluster-binding NifX family protein